MFISYEYYRVFCQVVRCGSFTGAAKSLMSNQPNVTRVIRNLEAALGCSLFVRSNQGVVLTDEGSRLYEHVRIAFEHIMAGEEEIYQNRGKVRGVVSVGISEVALHCLMLPVLGRYHSLHPDVRIHITNHSTPQAIAALKSGAVDISVVTIPTIGSRSLIEGSRSLAERRVKTVREVAICGPELAHLSDRKLSFEELLSYPIISLGPQTMTYELYSEFFRARGLSFSPDIETGTADQILPMVRHGLGIGFVPEEFLEGADGVYPLETEEAIPSRHICIVKRREQALGMAVRELERLILAASDGES